MKETVAGCCRYGTIWSCRKFLHNTFSVAYFSGYPPCCGKPNGHSHHPQFVHVTRVGFWGDRHPSKTHHAMWNSVELWVSGAIPKAWCMTNNHMAESPTHYTIYIPYTTFAKLRFTCSWVYLKQPQFSWTLNFLVDNNPVEHVNGRGMFVPNVYKHKENQRNICWSEISQLLMVTLLRSGKKKQFYINGTWTYIHRLHICCSSFFWSISVYPRVYLYGKYSRSSLTSQRPALCLEANGGIPQLGWKPAYSSWIHPLYVPTFFSVSTVGLA